MELKNFPIDLRRATFAKVGLIDLYNYLKANSDQPLEWIIEIGSFSGVSAWLFSHYFLQVLCVDPWKSNFDPNDDASDPNKFDMVRVEAQFDEIAKEMGNIEKLKMTSEEASKLFSDNSVRVCFVDALHTYEGVKKDICLWYPKIEINGWFCFHDFSNVKHHPGVKKAVLELMGEPDQVFRDTSCVFRMTEKLRNKIKNNIGR